MNANRYPVKNEYYLLLLFPKNVFLITPFILYLSLLIFLLFLLHSSSPFFNKFSFTPLRYLMIHIEKQPHSEPIYVGELKIIFLTYRALHVCIKRSSRAIINNNCIVQYNKRYIVCAGPRITDCTATAPILLGTAVRCRYFIINNAQNFIRNPLDHSFASFFLYMTAHHLF